MATTDGYGARGLPPAVDGLLRLSAAVTQRLNQHLQDAAQLSLAQYQFLWVAAGGPVALGEVAAVLGCTRGNVTGLADRLIEQGLVVRRQDPDDRRVVYVELTPAGRARLAEAGAAVHRALRELSVAGGLEALGESLLGQAAALAPAPPSARSEARGRRDARPTPPPPKPGRLRERDAAVRVAGQRRPVIVVRDDQVVRLGPGRPLAE